MTLKRAHRLFRSTGADSRLIPGDPLTALARAARNLTLPIRKTVAWPGTALKRASAKAQVFLLNEDNTVNATQVQLGELLSNDRVEILSGIQPGDRIVVEGAAYLKDGTLVEIVEPISTTIN